MKVILTQDVKSLGKKGELVNASDGYTAKAGQGGKIFGSVTAKEVAESISRQFGVSVDKRKVSMEDIKSFGTFSAEVKVYNGVNATVYVSVGEE